MDNSCIFCLFPLMCYCEVTQECVSRENGSNRGFISSQGDTEPSDRKTHLYPVNWRRCGSRAGKKRQKEWDLQANAIVWLPACLASMTLAPIQLSPPQCCPALFLNHPALSPFLPSVSLLHRSASFSFPPHLQPPPLSPSIAAHSIPGQSPCYPLFDPPRISFWVP